MDKAIVPEVPVAVIAPVEIEVPEALAPPAITDTLPPVTAAIAGRRTKPLLAEFELATN